jgi:predicted nucleic acid-binding protein
MIVISDSNILFSAMISPKGAIASILTDESKIQLIAPSYLLEELENHSKRMCEYLNISRAEFKKRLKLYTARIEFVDSKKIPKKYISEALEIVSSIDYDDFLFVALSRYKNSKLWTGDESLIKGLKSKGYNICITTSEIKKYKYKK